METERYGRTRTNDKHRQEREAELSVPVGGGPGQLIPASVLVANAALSLLNLCCYFLDRQLAAQAAKFEQEGGFTERLYRVRSTARKSRS